MKTKLILPIFFLALLSSLGGGATAQEAPIIAAGSGVNLAITKILAQAYMKARPDTVIEVPGSIGSKGAIVAVVDGGIALGLISRPLKAEEEAKGLVAVPYASTPVVIAANQSVKDEALTSPELVDIFRGTKKRWNDGREIIVQTREPFDSGMQILEKSIPGFKEAYAESQKEKRWIVYFTDQESNQALSKTADAVGVTDLGMIMTEKLSVKPLKLDGVTPSPETLASGAYPLKRTLFLLHRADGLPEKAAAFKAFLYTPEAQAIMRANGYLPEDGK